jgi:hypothetical protein
MASITPSYDREGEHIGWQVAVRKKGYPPQYKTFRTRKEGEAWASVTESEMVRGVWRDRSEAESTTLKECLDRYLAEVTPKKKSKGEGWYVKAWMTRPIASRFMASIRGKDLASEIRAMESIYRTPWACPPKNAGRWSIPSLIRSAPRWPPVRT